MDKRYKLLGNYVVDRWIIQACMLLAFGFLFYTAYSHNFEMDYLVCSMPGMTQDARDITVFKTDVSLYNCTNPFYRPSTWKNQKDLPIGVYGEDPSLAITNSCFFILFIFALGFGVNHLIYNLKKKPKIEEAKTTYVSIHGVEEKCKEK